MNKDTLTTNAPTPNDQRSVTKNPPTDEYAKDRENRVKLGHPNIPPAPSNASSEKADPRTNR